MKVIPIPAFNDNYIWCITNADHAWVVDPGSFPEVVNYLEQINLPLTGILITHHHQDHTGAVGVLSQHYPGLEVIGPDNPAIPGITQTVADGDIIEPKGLKVAFDVMAVPGHTLDHLAYLTGKHLFCGDTLFSGGCGRLFEGSAEQMYQSLQQLANLPSDTLVYAAHEYTLANLKFAQTVEPNNQQLDAYLLWCQKQRDMGLPTLPSQIGMELTINPFLRVDQDAVVKQLNQRQAELTNNVQRFAALRTWKDNFS